MLLRVLLLVLAIAPVAAAQESTAFKVLASNKTSTMQRELTAAAEAGYRFVSVMGGDTAFGGNEVVALLQKTGSARPRFAYRVLATSKTSTMQKELQAAADEGYVFVGQTLFESTFGGREVAVILERDKDRPVAKHEYRLIATSKTSTLQKELDQLGAAGYEAVAMTVGQTAMGGAEIVVIARKAR